MKTKKPTTKEKNLELNSIKIINPIDLSERMDNTKINYVEMPKPLPKYKIAYWIRAIKERDRKIKVLRFIKKSERVIKEFDKIKNSEEQLKHESVKEATSLKEVLKEQVNEGFEYKKFISKYTIKYWIEYYKAKHMKRRIFLIVMQLRNGKYDIFTIVTNQSYFERNSGMYHIDTDMAREDLHSKMNLLYYHQDISSPFRIDFDLGRIHKLMETNEESTIDKALNPSSLKGFINSQVIEKVLKGQELSDEMRFLKIIMIINLIITIILGFMIAKGMGWM